MRVPLTALAAVAALAASADGAAAGWRPPVDGTIVRAFDLGADPFEGGRHRGIDLSAAAGTAVRAPCGGEVAFAGPVGTSGRVVTLLCEGWRVSHMPLATIAVPAGAAVRRGAPIGTVAASHEHTGLHLGVRRDGTRFGYVDPARFLTATDLPPPLAPVRPHGPRAPRLGPAPRLRLAPRLGPAPRPHAAPRPISAPRTIVTPPAAPPALVAGPHAVSVLSKPGSGGLAPWPAWAGLALVLAGLGVRWRRRPPEGRSPRPAGLPQEVR